MRRRSACSSFCLPLYWARLSGPFVRLTCTSRYRLCSFQGLAREIILYGWPYAAGIRIPTVQRAGGSAGEPTTVCLFRLQHEYPPDQRTGLLALVSVALNAFTGGRGIETGQKVCPLLGTRSPGLRHLGKNSKFETTRLREGTVPG